VKDKATKEKEDKKRLKKEKDVKEREEKKRLQAEEDEKRRSVLLQAAAHSKPQQVVCIDPEPFPPLVPSSCSPAREPNELRRTWETARVLVADQKRAETKCARQEARRVAKKAKRESRSVVDDILQGVYSSVVGRAVMMMPFICSCRNKK
jgi:hypothetical protein